MDEGLSFAIIIAIIAFLVWYNYKTEYVEKCLKTKSVEICQKESKTIYGF